MTTIRRMTDVTAFAQNQRDEVRLLGDKTTAIQAELGTHQQTFPMQKVFNKSTKPKFPGDCGKYTEAKVSPTLNTFDVGETRVASVVVEKVKLQPCTSNVLVGINEDKERTCFAWKNRDRESKLVIGQSSPLAATDYKEPNLVGYKE